MGLGGGNLQTLSKNDPTVIPPPGPPFLLTSAANGLSVDPVSKKIVLGQSIGAVGDPAQLLDDREIPLKGFTINHNGLLIREILNDTTGIFQITDTLNNPFLYIDLSNDDYAIGDFNSSKNGCYIEVFDAGKQIFIDAPSGNIFIGDTGIGSLEVNGAIANGLLFRQGGGGKRFVIDPPNNLYKLGDIDIFINGSVFEIDDNVSEFKFTNSATNASIRMNGVNGFTGTVTPVTTITVNGGIVTNVA